MPSRYTDSTDKGVRFDGAVCLRETDAAVLIEHKDFEEPTWVPKSCIHDDSEVFGDDDEGDLVVTTWFAKKQGWA